MAQQNGFNAMFGVEFEDFNSVKKKLDVLTKQVNTETSKGIKLNIDTNQITKTINDLSRLSKQNIQILPNGQITTISKFNQELGKTITLTKNLSNNTVKISMDNNVEKAYTQLFDEAIKRQDETNKMYSQISEKRRKESEQEALESNRILQEKYNTEQQFINVSQKLKQKSSQESIKQAQQEAKINNDLLLQKHKDDEKRKQELVDAQKLVDYEKQRLNLRLESVNLNRKGLTNETASTNIGNSIKSLDGNNVNEVRDRVKQLNLEIQKLDQNARMKGLQVGNKNIMSFGESIKTTATKLGIFVSTAMVLNEVQRAVRNATTYIIELDKSMVDLKKVTDETSDTYDKFLTRMHDVALSLGTQSNLMVDATTNWAKTGKNLQEASKLAENTILLTKVGDVENVDTAQKYMVAPLKAFNIEAEKSITLIDKYNNISNNMATTVQDVGEGLNIASNSLGVAGNSLEESIALIATAESATKQGGSVIGNALKTISLRLATFEDDETGELIPELADDLEKLGISAVDSAGQIRSTFDILRDLSKIYKDLDKNTQLKLSEQIGGKRQANIVASILTNSEEIDRAYNLATNSAGSALNEFEKYTQGIEYALDQLKEQVNGLYSSFLNGGFFKGVVNGASDVISVVTTLNNTFGTVPTVVATVVGAMTIFNSKFRETTQMMLGFNPTLNKIFMNLNNSAKTFSQQGNLYKSQIDYLKNLTLQYQSVGLSTSGFGKQILDLNMKLALSTAKLVATKVAVVALEGAISMGLSLAVSFAISKIGEFIDKIIITKDELKDLNSDSLTAMQSNKELTSSVEELIKKEEDLKNKISTKGNTYEEQKQYRTELLDVQKQIADILPESANAFDEEGNKIASNTEKVLENLDAKKKLSESEAIKAIKNNSDYETIMKAPAEYEKTKKQLEDMQEAYKNNQLYMGSEVDSKWLEKIEKKVNEYEEAIKIMSASIESLRSVGWDEDRIAQEIFKDMPLESSVEWYNKLTSVTDSYNQSLQTVNESQKDFNNEQGKTNTQVESVSRLQKIYESLGYSIADAKKKAEELSTLSVGDGNAKMLADSTTAYSDAISKTKELETLIRNINEEQSMTPELVMQVADMYPEIGSRILSVTDTQEFLNQKISESVDAQRNAYNQMIANDNNYYSSKVKNDEAVQNNFNQLLSAFVTNSGEAYSTDLGNYSNLNELKTDLTAQYGEAVAELITNFVSSNADGYDVDLDNTVAWASSKAKILRDLSAQITKVENQLASHLKNIQKASGDGNTLEDEKLYAKAQKELNNLNTQKEEIMTEFYKYNSGFKGYTPTFSGSDFDFGKDGKTEKDTKKLSEALGDLSDRYFDVNNALKQLDNELKKNETLMKNASDEEKIKYLDKQLELINKQTTAYGNLKKEYNKELSELRNSLSASGFSFAGDGTVKNYQSRLDALTANADSITDPDKRESTQKNVKEIAEAIKRYNDLLLTQIPEVENTILDLKNTTIDTQKEIVDLIKKQKESYVENIKKETDALKKEIQKRRDLLSSQWDEEDFEDEKRKKENALLDLNAQLQDAMKMADSELVANIKKQIESAQQEINNFIRDNERDKADQRFEEELNKIDEDAEKRIEDITSKLTDEEILKMVQNGVRDLSSVLDNVGNANKSIATTFATVGDTIENRWVGGLDEFISKLKTINGIDTNFNANINRSAVGGGSSTTPNIDLKYELIVQGDMTEDVIPEVEGMIKKSQKETIKIITEKLRK